MKRDQHTRPDISLIILIGLCLLLPCQAQIEHIIIPQSRAHGLHHSHQRAIQLTSIKAKIDTLESTATTTLEIHLQNTTDQRQEAQLLLPVPEGAVVRGFAYDGPQGEITAKVLPKEEARRIYNNLVRRIKDPALVEFVGYNLIQSSVFPVEPHGKQRVRITYETILPMDGSRIDYILPRSESLAYAVPWQIEATIKAKQTISTVYSPSHDVIIKRKSPTHIKVKLNTQAQNSPGAFRLSILLEQGDVTASLFAYPDKNIGGGYFLMLAGLPTELKQQRPTMKRELTIVIDRSGSMRGEKLEQVKEAARQIIAGLDYGEAFNILIYSNSVDRYAERSVIKDRENEKVAHQYIDSITAVGGTNIHDALQTALQSKPRKDMLPIVLFLTDGLPTVGQTAEKTIGNLVSKQNPHKRRVFTLGVGYDVNGPLLRRVAEQSRAKNTLIQPQEDVEVKVGQVFASLTGPILANPEITILNQNGKSVPGRIRDMLPALLPDLFVGDRLVLLGQYVGKAPLTFRLTGNTDGHRRSFDFAFTFKQADCKNGFVARLWASRKIAELIDAVRQMGAEPGVTSNDPKIKELTEEIVRLSTEFGILTEYTAFLAREGTDLRDRHSVIEQTRWQLQDRAMGTRSGMGSFNQSSNLKRQKEQIALNYSNSFYNEAMQTTSTKRVQQINDLAFYNQGGRWIDSRIATQQMTPARTIIVGTDAYIELAEQLAQQGRQGCLMFEEEIVLLIDGKIVNICK